MTTRKAIVELNSGKWGTSPFYGEVSDKLKKLIHLEKVAKKKKRLSPNTFDLMDDLALGGWCVVLKRLPPKLGWVIEGARSEYDSPSSDVTFGVGKWFADAQWMGEEFRHREHAIADTPEKAIADLWWGICDMYDYGDGE